MTASKAILYSATLSTWEVWQESRPIAHGTYEACRDAHPDALTPAQQTVARLDALPQENHAQGITEARRRRGCSHQHTRPASVDDQRPLCVSCFTIVGE